jgi:hypothetical protein
MKAGRVVFAAMLVFALLAGTLSLYVAGYFWSGTREDWMSLAVSVPPRPIDMIERVYPHHWQMHLFQPAGKVEEWWRAIPVKILYRDPRLPYHAAERPL